MQLLIHNESKLQKLTLTINISLIHLYSLLKCNIINLREMMKKAVHIIFVSLFFLLGLQCIASNRTPSFLHTPRIENCKKFTCLSSFSKHEKNAYVSSIDKLHKKKRFSKTNYNAIASLSKCNNFSINTGIFSGLKHLFFENPKLLKAFSDYSFNNSFCHRKLLSIFYSFQAFW